MSNAGVIERYDPLDKGEFDYETQHGVNIKRYEFALKHIQGPIVGDIACGYGYGTDILTTSTKVSVVYGIDVDDAALARARMAYFDNKKLKFFKADMCNLEVRDLELEGGFDSMVCIETIEHVLDPQAAAQNLYRLIRPGGTLIVSAPVVPTLDFNFYHVTDFSEASLRGLFIKVGFREVAHELLPLSFNPVRSLRRRLKQGEASQGSKANVGSMVESEGSQSLFAFYQKNPKYLFKRMGALFKFGFTNYFLVVAFKK